MSHDYVPQGHILAEIRCSCNKQICLRHLQLSRVSHIVNTPASAVIAIDMTTLVRSATVMTCMHSTLSRQSVMVTAMRPHRAALDRSSASPAGLSLHAVRRSVRCRAADSGSDEQGEPQQQLKQVTEDVKQQAEEATQGTCVPRRSLILAGLMCMCLLVS